MKKHITIITTGGTIAMKQDPKTGGLVPAVSGEDLAAAVPGLSDAAAIDVVEFKNIPSGWMKASDMFALSRLIDRLAVETKTDGFVVTHGTDTLEETAFFLDVSLKTELPVCVTGAMRGASALSADGPENILAAVRTAADPFAKGQGVLVCLMDRVYAARSVTKMHTTNPDTFGDPEWGPLASVYSSRIIWGRKTLPHVKLHPESICEDVWLITCYSGMERAQVDAALAGGAKGVVIDSLGCGNVPPECKKGILALREHHIPVVITTRVPTGSVMEEYSYDGSVLSMKSAGIIEGGSLSAPKARLLFTLALGLTNSIDTLRPWFEA